MSLFDIDIGEFTSTVKASTISLLDPRNAKRREELIRNAPRLAEAVTALYRTIITPAVESAYMQSFLGDIRHEFDRHYEVPDCLDEFGGDEAVEVARGLDGVVYRLPGGQVAKMGIVHVHKETPIPDPHMERAMDEIAMARIAGKKGVSPKVKDSFFCCSVDTCYYVIIMEDIKGPTLSVWLRTASKKSKDAMRKKVLVLLKKLHDVGIVHMDLHAGNILVGEDEEPIIIDFSRSTYAGQNTTDLSSVTNIFDRLPSFIDDLVDLVMLDLIDMGRVRIK